MKRHPLHRLSLTIQGNRSAALETARSRLLVLGLVFICAYVIVAVRLFDVSVLQQNKEIAALYERFHTTVEAATQGRRADIVDRNGVLLATSLKTASLFADPKMILDPKGTAEELVALFPEESYDTLYQKLQENTRFVWIRRNLTPEEQADVMRIGDPGLAFKQGYTRIYPQGVLTAHIVGQVNIDGIGRSGLERAFDNTLREREDALEASLDIRLQHALHAEIQNIMKVFSAKAGSGAITDINTGEILALVSLPDFDPHGKYDANDPGLFNRVTLGVYELGSVFKIFSTAALLEQDTNALALTFDATEPLQRGRHTIRDFHPEKRVLTLPEVFMFSSNIGTALMGEKVGTDALKDFYKKLGFFDRPDIALKEVGRPIYPRPWRPINTLTASYGHGIAVSPLQVLRGASIVANGGFDMHPVFVKQPETLSSGDLIKTRLLSEKTSDVMRKLMRLVVTDGTAKKADVPGYEVAGKTGTAEKPGIGGYDGDKLISSFVGMFPAHDPKYGLFIAIDEPKGTKESFGYATAGWTAAPAAASVIERMVSILGLPAITHTVKSSEQGLKTTISVSEQDL